AAPRLRLGRMNFPTTQWSLLAQATLNDHPAGRHALGEFHRKYREPVLAFLRRRGLAPHDAEDMAQSFFIHLMQKATLRRADSAKGRFRSFLLGALMRHLAQAREQREAAKRGGGVPQVSLDAVAEVFAEPAVDPAEVLAYDRDWALQLLGRALEAVAAEFRKQGREADFAVLRAYLPGSVPPVPPYEDSAARLGLSLGAFKTEVHRLRGRVREWLRREIATTVSLPEEIDDEVAYLGRVLQSAAP
ncbi:MAG TPA: sigma factor, partial [Lacunisphaera sp.]|nr:sigma factor [Lacunisphaera sp.]